MPSKKKKYNSRFPPARIKKIMQTDEEVGKVAAAVPVIISRALELFIDSLITKSSETTISKNAKTLTTSHIKQTIHSEKKFDFLRDLVASIPDHQAEEEVGMGEGGGIAAAAAAAVEAKPVRKPRVVRPRKQKDGTVQKRRRKKKDESESSEEPEESEEETEEEEEELEGNGESTQALAGPSTSQQTFAAPLPPQASPTVPPQPPLGIFYPRMPVPNNTGVAAAATLTMPSSTPNQGLAEDDDYDDV